MLIKKEYYVIGDGNCGPRAIIQSLLLEGLAYPQHKQFVCNFLRGIYQRNKGRTEPYTQDSRHLSSLALDDIFGKYDPRPKPNMSEDTLYRLPLNQKTNLENQILTFINTYEKMEPTENNLNLLIERFIPQDRGVPPTHDHLIYLLAAYLRFDICVEMCEKNLDSTIQTFYREILPDLTEMGRLGYRTPIDEVIVSNNTLEKNTDSAFTASYLAKYGIGYLLLDRDSKGQIANNDIYFKSKQPTLSLIMLTTGLHFSIHWSNPLLSIRPLANLAEPLPESNIHSQRLPNSLTMHILNGFLVALGVFAVAMALTSLSSNAGIFVAGIGIGSLVIGGYGLFKQTEPTQSNLSCIPMPGQR